MYIQLQEVRLYGIVYLLAGLYFVTIGLGTEFGMMFAAVAGFIVTPIILYYEARPSDWTDWVELGVLFVLCYAVIFVVGIGAHLLHDPYSSQHKFVELLGWVVSIVGLVTLAWPRDRSRY